MSKHTIPAEAIEAAAMAILAVTPDVWELQSTGTKDRYRWDAQAALEAAAPHLLAEAWEAGKEAGHLDYHWTPNPYRSRS